VAEPDATHVSTDRLADALARHGLEAERFDRISTGKFNESWFVTFADGREVVLRVAPPDDAGFLFYERNMMRQEPSLHDTIRSKTSAPVAEIIAFDDSRAVIDRDFIVMERLPGRAMSDCALPPAAVERALEATGRHLRAVHDACRAEAYGYLGEHRCMEPADTWAEAFRDMWGRLIEDIRACGAYSDDEARAAVGALDARLSTFDRDAPASLLHMDIWAQNILVDDAGRVTGLVDWDRALWGDTEIEFAVLDYCGISGPAFRRGYGRERDASDDARVRWLFYHLYELQKYIVIRTLRGRSPEGALRYKREAARLLAPLL
jgi:aminoglycoside phosphotransferase (APT) family kinase protein